MGLGYLLGRILKVDRILSYLLSVGTAICGGSAIAAVSQVLNADENDISVSIGTVFILNAVALFIFPVMGHYFHLSQQQFGIWAAIAIHDTSSVVGAATNYGNHGETCTCVMDCSTGVAYLFCLQTPGIPLGFSVLYPFLPACIGCKQLYPDSIEIYACHRFSSKDWIQLNLVPHWYGNFTECH
jgi:hypothetical protein